MSNNIAVTAGSGTNVATDQGPSGEHYQLVKLVNSTEDSTTRTGLASDPLQVSMGSGVTVYQGSQPWSSLGTVTIATPIDLKSLVTASIPGGVTVYQGTGVWNSLGTVTIASLANVTASIPSGVTVFQGTSVWNSLGTQTLANGVGNIGFATVTPSTLARTISANVTVQQGSIPWNSLGTMTIASIGNVTASIPSGVTVFQGSAVWNSLGTSTLAGSLPAGVNNIGFATITPTTTTRTISANVTVNQGTTPWLSLGTATLSGSLPAGVNGIGFATVAQGTSPWNSLGTQTIASGIGNIGFATINGGQISLIPKSAGGCSICRNIDVDESEDDVHGATGQIYGYFMSNTNATVARYVKFYNSTAANTTVGLTTPIMTIPLLAGQGANAEFSNGIPFSTALCMAATTGVADNDTGAPATNDVVVNLFYK